MHTYVVSFGDSAKYRIKADPEELANLKDDIKEYLVKRFPQLGALDFFDRISVVKVDPSNEADYVDYPEFNADSVAEIERVLSREVEDEESLRTLNLNAPFDS